MIKKYNEKKLFLELFLRYYMAWFWERKTKTEYGGIKLWVDNCFGNVIRNFDVIRN